MLYKASTVSSRRGYPLEVYRALPIHTYVDVLNKSTALFLMFTARSVCAKYQLILPVE